MKTIKFTCQKCGKHRLEEVMTGVTVTSPIYNISIDEGIADCEYESSCNDGGEVDCFRCLSCGHVVEGVKTLEELVEFLDNQQEVQRRDEKNGLYPEHLDPAN